MKEYHIFFVVLGLFFVFNVGIAVANYPDKPYCSEVYVQGTIETIALKDGINLSNKNLQFQLFHRLTEDLNNINFDGSNLRFADFEETYLVACSFRKAILHGVHNLSCDEQCDFTDALVSGHGISLNTKQLCSTESYKTKNLRAMRFSQDLKGVSLAGFDLRRCGFSCSMEGCNIKDALIQGSSFDGQVDLEYVENPDPKTQTAYPKVCRFQKTGITKEQLLTTRDFKFAYVSNVSFSDVDFSHSDFSNMNFSGCYFGMTKHLGGNGCNFTGVKLTDAVISNCNFRGAVNLTAEQIKSTWNYKNGRMTAVILPKYLLKEFGKKELEQDPFEPNVLILVEEE